MFRWLMLIMMCGAIIFTGYGLKRKESIDNTSLHVEAHAETMEQVKVSEEVLQQILEIEKEKERVEKTSTPRYLVTYEIKPSSHSLKFRDMVRAGGSEFTWNIYVDKQAFDECEIGDKIHIDASYMDYNITVVNKTVE